METREPRCCFFRCEIVYEREKEELLFLRKSGISALATSGKNASSSGAHMRFQNDAVEDATSLLSRAAGNSVERMAKLLECNFCGLENREAVDWLDLATCEATGTGGLSMTGRNPRAVRTMRCSGTKDACSNAKRF